MSSPLASQEGGGERGEEEREEGDLGMSVREEWRLGLRWRGGGEEVEHLIADGASYL